MVPAMVVVCVGSSLLCAQQAGASAKLSASVVSIVVPRIIFRLLWIARILDGHLSPLRTWLHFARTAMRAAIGPWSYRRERAARGAHRHVRNPSGEQIDSNLMKQIERR